MSNPIFTHKYVGTNTEVWTRPGRVDLDLWDTTTKTATMTPDEAEQLAEALSQAAREARQ